MFESDSKSITGYLLGIIKNLPNVRAKKVPIATKSKLLEELEEAVHELNEINAGRKKGRDAREFLNEL